MKEYYQMVKIKKSKEVHFLYTKGKSSSLNCNIDIPDLTVNLVDNNKFEINKLAHLGWTMDHLSKIKVCPTCFGQLVVEKKNTRNKIETNKLKIIDPPIARQIKKLLKHIKDKKKKT